MHNVEIRGTGSYIPDRVVHNDELSQIVDTSDQWIRERTGIRERRISTGENTSELAVKAARKALADAEVKAEEIGLIIVATVTPDKFFLLQPVSCKENSLPGKQCLLTSAPPVPVLFMPWMLPPA